MDALIVAFIGFLGLVATGMVTWLVARRATSGEIDTSDAAQLWLEGQNMRRDLRDEVVVLRSKVNELEVTRQENRDTIVILRSKVSDLEAKAQIMTEKIIRLEAVVR